MRTVEVKRGDISAKVAETGWLEPAQVVEIKSEQSGEVKDLFVEVGDQVEAGQTLATIQQESRQAQEAAQRRADIEKERLNLEEAQRDLERNQILFSKKFISQKDLEAAEKKRKDAKTRYDLAKRQLLLSLGGNRELFERYMKKDISSDDQLDEFIITSPRRGTIIELTVEKGEKITSGTATVGGGTTVMKIADLKKMLIKTKINEVNIAQMAPGHPVDIRLDALPAKGYHGVVAKIAPQGEKINNVVTYEVTIEITDPDSDLKPLMTANIDIITDVAKNVLFLPVEALFRENGEDTVYVRNGNQRVPRRIRIGLRTETVAVIQEGLTEGEVVVIPLREREPERA